jgi:hypothetical protein
VDLCDKAVWNYLTEAVWTIGNQWIRAGRNKPLVEKSGKRRYNKKRYIVRENYQYQDRETEESWKMEEKSC